MEVWYSLCDENDHPIAWIYPCVYDKSKYMNASLTWIPRSDLHHLSVKLEVWHQLMKISEEKFELCTGMDDEYYFCSIIKGETVSFSTYRSLSKMPFPKGNFTFNIWVYAGEQEKLSFCVNVTLIVKV
ncbi:lymphocyte antigen 96-like [Xenopus laevis]|uniref:MD-2-related lipid-recognition domain-containing protein n=2 Tax=Xenopus laevis TaxID=8355 RepID=A0A974CKP6_XENLA|nr:lymphocyte antigen 96-like [Xenopus laevis]OCT74818.1 hypothetical protein XELAEV_18033805mg [Xenopus laevis]